jgi:hypothetical protein
MTGTEAKHPWRTAFSAATAFPSAVRGPVDFSALARLAAIFASEVMFHPKGVSLA